MIISASRRTDLPAFYGEWLEKRLREGRVLVPNPYNPRQVRDLRFTRKISAVWCSGLKTPGRSCPGSPASGKWGTPFISSTP